jgi:hypothetical protein
VVAASQALELTCPLVQPDQQVDWTEPVNYIQVLTADPFNSAVSVPYGNPLCSGFVIDVHNPNAWYPGDLFVDGGDGSTKDNPAGMLAYGTPESCSARTFSGDLWGMSDGVWTPIYSETVTGRFEDRTSEDAGFACLLGVGLSPKSDQVGSQVTINGTIAPLGNYQTYRFIGRVSNGSSTYPFRIVFL